MATEVFLMAEVPHLGSEGDVVTVADGYARNYLLPKNLAAPVTSATRRKLAKIQQEREEARRAQTSADKRRQEWERKQQEREWERQERQERQERERFEREEKERERKAEQMQGVMAQGAGILGSIVTAVTTAIQQA